MMKRWILIPTAALALAACGDGGPLAPAGADLDDGDLRLAEGAIVASANGGANWTLEVFGFTIPQVLGFTAREYADGRVEGHIEYHQVFLGERLRFVATVTCMEIYDGNRVKYGGEILQSNDPAFPPGGFMWFQSIDNGEGAAAPPDESTGSGFGTEAENEAFCDSPDLPNPLFLAEVNGNIQVRE